MDHLVIDGVPGYDGRYEFDLSAGAFIDPRVGLDQTVHRLSAADVHGRVEGRRRGADVGVRDHRAGTRPARSTATRCRKSWERFGDAPGILTVRLELENDGGG